MDEHDAEALLRGAAQTLPDGGLTARLQEATAAGRPLRVKFGIDPSGAELTLGHAVVLRMLRRFQDAGHTVVLVIGDFTGTVGDPTGRSATRKVLTLEETTENAADYLRQALLVLSETNLEVVRNSEWLSRMTLPEMLAVASNVTVAQLLERDDFQKRHRAGQPIALSEFYYPLLQGIDSREIRADVETGGSDQFFNMVMGRELQRAAGQPPQVVVTVPILEGLDGTRKMSKSLGNYVSLTEPAEEQFGKLMSIPDNVVGRYATLCTDLPADDVAGLERAVAAGGPGANRAKRHVAREIVALYHGSDAAEAAEAAFDRLFRQHEVPTEIPEAELGGEESVYLPALLASMGLAPSRSEGRRLLESGAVRVDGEQVRDLEVPRDELVGRVVQVGKRRFLRLV